MPTFWKKTTNKYHNKRCKCNLGHIHDSRFEAGHCNHLQLLQKAGEIKEFRSQKSFQLHSAKGKTVCSHIVDFLITFPDDRQVVHECKSKGTVTQIWKLKKAMFEHEYGDEIEYIVVWK